MRSRHLFIALSLLSALGLAVTASIPHAAATEPASPAISCPESISVEQRTEKVAPGWSARSTGSLHRLWRVTLYMGHPAQLGSLVPDEEEPRAGGKVGVVWKLMTGAGPFWLECGYRDTDVVLFRQVPKEARRCEFVTNPKMLLNGVAELVSTRCE